jgi:diacylglycerol kinase family enzyme
LHEDKAFSVSSHAVLVVNPVSGGGKWDLHRNFIEESLSRQYELTILETHPEANLNAQLANIITQDTQCIIACGGDGTLREVAQTVLTKNIVFGIIPLGTTNALAHALFGNLSKVMGVKLSCDIILQNNVKKLDVAWCNDEMSLLALGVGFEATMIAKADREKKNTSGQLAYLQGLGEAVLENESQVLDFFIDDTEQVETEVSSLMVANAAPFTTVLAQGNGQPDPFDGKLDVTLFGKLDSPLSLFNALISPPNEMQTDIRETETPTPLKKFQIEKLQLRSESKFNYVIDGEVRTTNDLLIKIHKQALKIFVPLD